MNALPWWTLPAPTVDGRRYLDCHYSTRAHRAVVITDPARTCDRCSTVLVGHAWADLDRTTVLCGRCHGAAHRPDDEQRANAADAYAIEVDR